MKAHITQRNIIIYLISLVVVSIALNADIPYYLIFIYYIMIGIGWAIYEELHSAKD
jgi:hypothetical protein